MSHATESVTEQNNNAVMQAAGAAGALRFALYDRRKLCLDEISTKWTVRTFGRPLEWTVRTFARPLSGLVHSSAGQSIPLKWTVRTSGCALSLRQCSLSLYVLWWTARGVRGGGLAGENKNRKQGP